MKLPEKIKGRNRIRDGAIVLYFKRDAWDFCDLCKKFNLTEMRIRQILATNHAFIKRDKDWEKEKRINLINRWIKVSASTKKDPADLLAQLKDELEGQKISHEGIPASQVNIYPTKTIIFRDIDDNGTTDRSLHEPQSAEGSRIEGTIQSP